MVAQCLLGETISGSLSVVHCQWFIYLAPKLALEVWPFYLCDNEGDCLCIFAYHALPAELGSHGWSPLFHSLQTSCPVGSLKVRELFAR